MRQTKPPSMYIFGRSLKKKKKKDCTGRLKAYYLDFL